MLKRLLIVVVCILASIYALRGPGTKTLLSKYMAESAGLALQRGNVTMDFGGTVHLRDASVRLISTDTQGRSTEAPTEFEHAVIRLSPKDLLHRRFAVKSLGVNGLNLPIDLHSRLSGIFGSNQTPPVCENNWVETAPSPFETDKQWRLISPELGVWDEISNVSQELTGDIQLVTFQQRSLTVETEKVLRTPLDFDNSLRDENIRKVRATTKELLEKIAVLKKSLEEVDYKRKRNYRDLESNRVQDFATIAQRVERSNQSADLIADELLRNFVHHQLLSLEPYGFAATKVSILCGRDQPMVDSLETVEGQQTAGYQKPSRRGVDYVFPEMSPIAMWRIDKAAIRGNAHLTHREIPFRGVATNLAASGLNAENPATIELMFDPSNDEEIRVLFQRQNATFDVHNEYVEIESRCPSPQHWEINNRQPVRIEISSTGSRRIARLQRHHVSNRGSIELRLDDCRLTLSPQPGLVASTSVANRDAEIVAAALVGQIKADYSITDGKIAITITDSNLKDSIVKFFQSKSLRPSAERVALQRVYQQNLDSRLELESAKTQEQIAETFDGLVKLASRLTRSADLIARKLGESDSQTLFARPNNSDSKTR